MKPKLFVLPLAVAAAVVALVAWGVLSLGCVAPGAARFTVLDEAGVRVLAERLLPPVEAGLGGANYGDIALAVMYAGNQYWKRHRRGGGKSA